MIYQSKSVVASLVVLTAVASWTVPAALAAAPSFQGLGDLPGGSFGSYAQGVSADGTVVVGYGSSTSGTEAIYWTADGGMVGMGDLPGGSFRSEATAVSADGAVVVGVGATATGTEAFRWTADGGLVGLGNSAASFGDSNASATSADGSVIVGRGYSDSGHQEAFRWTADGGMIGLGNLPGGSFGAARATSADGSVVVGNSTDVPGSDGSKAFRWTADGGMVDLGDLAGGPSLSYAYGISQDGSVVVGQGYSDSGREAFRWTADGGMVGLGDLPGSSFYSGAKATSADGSVVVGGSVDGVGIGPSAFIWDALNGMRSIQDMLTNDFGLDLTGWHLGSATDISADGTTIVGSGRNPNGGQEAWIATIPEPTTLALLALGSLLGTRRRR